MIASRRSFTLAVLLLCTAAIPARAEEKKLSLTSEDKKYLDGLMKEFLFDPKGAERVTVQTIVRTAWATFEEATAEGWFVSGKNGKAGRVYFTDGASIPAPPLQAMKKLDFRAACKARYAAVAKTGEKGDPDIEEAFRKMRQTAIGALEADDLALAAWLYRFGEEALAARALAASRKGGEDACKRLRGELAWSAFAGMVHAYMVRADEEALAHGERLLRLYPKEAKEEGYHQVARIVKELKRRQKKGTFGTTPSKKWPDGFKTWNDTRKIAYLIDALEEVDARQWGQPGGVDLASDRRVEALIRLGDVAVPALIDALENDERLTRSVHFWRDFDPSRTVLSVREAVLTALMSILRVRVFEPASTGDNFTVRGDDAATKLAKRLRAYWKEYGHLPFDERMMKVLTDAKTSFAAKREAAANLASLTQDRRLGTTIHVTIIGPKPPPKPNPAVPKFKKPTVAEAILAAMDADLKAENAKPREKSDDYQRHRIEEDYLEALVGLGDDRIAPELVKRADAASSPRWRRLWASAAHDLGEFKPLRRFIEDFRAGKIKLSDQELDEELRGILSALIAVHTPAAERALEAVTDPRHPRHRAIAEKLLSTNAMSSEGGPWFKHPYCLRILRAALDNTKPTGATYVIEENSLRRKRADGWSGGRIPDFLVDPAKRRDRAAERVCDLAAEQLGDLVIGLPLYHPLLRDAEKRLEAMKRTLDRFGGNYRRASWRESELLSLSPWEPAYLPDIRPLGRAATSEDVKAGKALFHLNGKGQPVNLAPAVAVLKRDAKKKRPSHVLIVQAEVTLDGQLTFGILLRKDIRAIAGNELIGVKTFAELEKEERVRKKNKND